MIQNYPPPPSILGKSQGYTERRAVHEPASCDAPQNGNVSLPGIATLLADRSVHSAENSQSSTPRSSPHQNQNNGAPRAATMTPPSNQGADASAATNQARRDSQLSQMPTSQTTQSPPVPVSAGQHSLAPPGQPQPQPSVAPGPQHPQGGVPPPLNSRSPQIPQHAQTAPVALPQQPMGHQPMPAMAPQPFYGWSKPSAGPQVVYNMYHPSMQPMMAMPVMGMPTIAPQAPSMYPAPQQDPAFYGTPRFMGPRSQTLTQEIKRRTKTGCLTCRRRRIKCDEQHPMCKNCCKSERICLGYDPIFSSDKNARLKMLRLKRSRFLQRRKQQQQAIKSEDNAPMKIDSLIEQQCKAVKNWDDLLKSFSDLAGLLDQFLGTTRFTSIAQSISLQLRHIRSNPRDCKIAGELEVIRQFVSIVYSDQDFDALDVLDIAAENLEKLRTTHDYILIRSLVEAMSLIDRTFVLHPGPNERLQYKIESLHTVLFKRERSSHQGPQNPGTGAALTLTGLQASLKGAATDFQAGWNAVADLTGSSAPGTLQADQVYALLNEAKSIPQCPLSVLILLAAISALQIESKVVLPYFFDMNLDALSRTFVEIALDPSN